MSNDLTWVKEVEGGVEFYTCEQDEFYNFSGEPGSYIFDEDDNEELVFETIEEIQAHAVDHLIMYGDYFFGVVL